MHFTRLKKRLPQIILGLSALLMCAAAQAETEEDGRYWFSFGVQSQIKETPWRWSFDVRPRWREEGRDFDQLLVAPLVTYQVNEKVNVGFGYDYVTTHHSGREAFTEQRVYPMFNYRFDDIAKLQLQTRIRFEVRDGESSSEIGYRYRQQLRLSYPIAANISLVAFDEFFVNLNDVDWGLRRGMDQNRVFLGFNWRPNSHWNTEFGYMNQEINTRKIDRENHILSSTIRYIF